MGRGQVAAPRPRVTWCLSPALGLRCQPLLGRGLQGVPGAVAGAPQGQWQNQSHILTAFVVVVLLLLLAQVLEGPDQTWAQLHSRNKHDPFSSTTSSKAGSRWRSSVLACPTTPHLGGSMPFRCRWSRGTLITPRIPWGGQSMEAVGLWVRMMDTQTATTTTITRTSTSTIGLVLQKYQTCLAMCGQSMTWAVCLLGRR